MDKFTQKETNTTSRGRPSGEFVRSSTSGSPTSVLKTQSTSGNTTAISISVVALIFVFAFLYFFTGAFGGTFLGITLKTNPDLEQGLVAHYTFDAASIGPNVDVTGGDALWSTSTDLGTGNDDTSGIATDASGNVYVTGRLDNGADDRWYTMKIDGSTGNALWSTSTDLGTGTDVPSGIATDASGNVYVTGSCGSGCGTLSAWYTMKIDGSTGDALWSTSTDPGTGYDTARGIATDASGNVYVTGDCESGCGTLAAWYTMKIDGSTGDALWSTSTDLGTGNDIAYAIATDASGNAYVTGRLDNGADDRWYTMKIDGSTGDALWSTSTDPGTGYDAAQAIATNASGNVYVTGSCGSGCGTLAAWYTMKIDGSTGDALWSTSTDLGTGSDSAYAIATDASGNAYVTGKLDNGSDDLWYTMKIDGSTGNALWSTSTDLGTGIDVPSGIATDASGNAYVTGYCGTGCGTGGAWYTMKIEGSDTVANDIITTGVPTRGNVGQAVSFDGVDDYIDGGNQGSANTVALWVRRDTTGAEKLINIDGTDQIEINGSNQVVATSFPAATVYIDGSSASAVINDDYWHHVAIVDTTGVTASTFEIGRVSTGYFDGKIDDVRVYSRALSASEISRLYDLGATTKIAKTIDTNPDLRDGILAHYSFDAVSIGPISVEATEGDALWSTSTDLGTGNDVANSIATDASGNAYVTGYLDNGSDDRWYTMKIDGSTGDALWSTSTDLGTGGDVANSIATDSSGDVYVTGYCASGCGASSAWYTMKIDGSTGNALWSTSTDLGTGFDIAHGIATDASGDVYLTGDCASGCGTGYTWYTMKIDGSTGNALWSTITDPSGGNDGSEAITTDASGDVYVTGDCDTCAGTDRYYTVKLDGSTGDELWATSTIPGGGNDLAYGIASDSNNDVYVTGRCQTGCGTGYTWYTIKIDGSTGDALWSTSTDPGTGNDIAYGIATDSSGDVYVTGYCASGCGASSAWYTMKIDGITGDALWSTSTDLGTGNDYTYGIATDASGDVHVTGFCGSGCGTGYAWYTMKIAGSDTVANDIITTGVPTRGNVGQAVSFDGVDDYIDGGNQGSANTVALWVRRDTTGAEKLINIDGTDQIEINGSNQVVATSFPAATVYIDGSSASAVINDDYWHHVAIVDTTGVTASTFEIGRVSTGYFDGKIDDVRVYSRALSASEISRLYDLGATTKIAKTIDTNPDLRDGILAHYSFDAVSIGPNVDVTGGDALWSTSTDLGTGNDIAYGIATDASGDVYVTGYCGSGCGTGYAWYTMKIDGSMGNALWSTSTDLGTGNDIAYAIATDVSGDVYVTGYLDNGTDDRWYTTKIDGSTGDALWSTSTDLGTGNDIAYAIATDVSGDVYVTGYLDNGTDDRWYTTKIDGSTGDALWSTSTDLGTGNDIAYGIATDASGDVYVTGYCGTGCGTGGAWYTMKIDGSMGNALWSTSTDLGTGNDIARGIATDASGDVYVTGYLDNGSDDRWYTMKIDGSTGNALWSTSADLGTGNDIAYGIATDASGDTYVTGYCGSGCGTLAAWYTMKIDGSTGDALWSTSTDLGTGNDIALAIATDASGDVYVTGRLDNGADDRWYTMKIAGSDTVANDIITTGVPTRGNVGQAVSFDGVDDYIDGGNQGSANTVALWVRRDTTGAEKLINIDGTDQIEINGSNQVVATSFPAATVYIDGSSASAVINDDYWHHVAIVDTTGVTASTFEIGRVSTGYFDGKIDDVRVYSRALSASEISRLYQLGQ